MKTEDIVGLNQRDDRGTFEDFVDDTLNRQIPSPRDENTREVDDLVDNPLTEANLDNETLDQMKA